MPYTEAHHKITVYGDAYNGIEQWSFGFRMRAVAPLDNMQQRADALVTPVTNFWSDATTLVGFLNTHRLQGIKVATIDVNGLYPEDTNPGEVFFANVPGPVGPSATSQFHPQATVCVTLRSARLRGLASHGRFFLPPSNHTVGSDGLMPVATRDAYIAKVKTFLDAVNQIDAGNSNIAIFSRGKGVKTFDAARGKVVWSYPNAGRTEIVDHFEIGRVVDTQRRRRRSLLEAKAGNTVTQ